MAEVAPGRLLAVIPARGGSKRLPRKNVLPLAGRPLIQWSIDAALASGVFDAVLVSTDDEEIAAAARAAGALVPWLRPADLASDTATSAAVLQHALEWYECERGPAEAVVLLQPTSPFRRAGSIREAVAAYHVQNAVAPRAAVVSVSPAAQHPAWCFRLGEGATMEPFQGWDALQRRSQDLPPAYALNGSIYVLPAPLVRGGGALLQPGTRAFVMADLHESLDIDTAEDWAQAQAQATHWERG
ncbi:acylneuraminate cytidylyltransferase family protein [Azohydromonas lata]|uniref:Acylneuraminate cytidylyltransferase family protein n=1 Tax=Azohydromonas lata TaxID=45677 RepID=A0ABU5IC41_9BURK|nr:acylneuraminate cytidylyltransferase family protein [Azohydromonas lata]MDZ5456533.1 acylneuraminate cytidylyltransferase family protein [Azohydromonas lata]